MNPSSCSSTRARAQTLLSVSLLPFCPCFSVSLMRPSPRPTHPGGSAFFSRLMLPLGLLIFFCVGSVTSDKLMTLSQALQPRLLPGTSAVPLPHHHHPLLPWGTAPAPVQPVSHPGQPAGGPACTLPSHSPHSGKSPYLPASPFSSLIFYTLHFFLKL